METRGNFVETTRDDAIRKDDEDVHLPRSVVIFQPRLVLPRHRFSEETWNSVRSNSCKGQAGLGRSGWMEKFASPAAGHANLYSPSKWE